MRNPYRPVLRRQSRLAPRRPLRGRTAADMPPRPTSPRELTTEQEAFRDSILGIAQLPSMGGIKRFDGLSGSDLQMLIDEGYADPRESHNMAPSVGFFADYAGYFQNSGLHGYAVSSSRPDCRISIEGIEITQYMSPQEQDTFSRHFMGADEFEVSEDYAYCWFD